jgi:signal transduction histidine kinase
LIQPIQIGNKTIGTIGLTRDSDGQPYTRDQTLVDILANRTAQIVYNARLYQELQNSLRKELEVHDQLVQSEKFAAVGRLLASITHEINNPLQTIKNCLFLSQVDTLSDSPIYEYLKMASTETDRLSNLVAQLREIYRPPTQGQSRPVNLPALIDEVQILLASYLKEKHVGWEVIPPDPDLMAHLKVEGVPDQLKQVFLNIALNAIDAIEPKGGRITIDFKLPADNNHIGICFRDTGPGLPKEVKNKLFEPFTTTRKKAWVLD